MKIRATSLTMAAIMVAACTSTPQVAPSNVAPTASATPFVPPSETPSIGSGKVTFGTAYNKRTLEIKEQKAAFSRTAGTIAWSAELTEAAQATHLTIVIARVSSGGSEHQVHRERFDITNPDSDIIAAEMTAALMNYRAGRYVLRVFRDVMVLAEGTFSLR